MFFVIFTRLGGGNLARHTLFNFHHRRPPRPFACPAGNAIINHFGGFSAFPIGVPHPHPTGRRDEPSSLLLKPYARAMHVITSERYTHLQTFRAQFEMNVVCACAAQTEPLSLHTHHYLPHYARAPRRRVDNNNSGVPIDRPPRAGRTAV